MALLQVFKDGQKIKELVLKSDKEWIVGRASDSDLVLEGEKGISRQHLKIYFESGKWTVEVLSRYGELYQSGRKVTSLHLESGNQFEVPPFEFKFIDNEPMSAHIDENTSVSDVSPVDFSDRTFVGQMALLPILRVCNETGETVLSLNLEGHNWIGGRDISCALFIDNPKFSRKHFEIRLEEGAYLIKDLGSSNGTLLNDEPLSTTSWTQLKSGDVLSVVDWTLHFELRDPSFEDKLSQIPMELKQPLMVSSHHTTSTALYTNGGAYSDPFQATPPPSAQSGAVSGSKKPNIVRILIGVLLVGGLVAYFLQDGGSGQQAPVQNAKSNPANPFEKLTPQQQQYVKDTYRLADRLFKEGRYEMARQEVAKIHQLVPNFEESKNLEKLADIAIQTQVEQQKAEAREREKAEMEEKIERTVTECRKKLNSRISMSAMDDCLMPVVPLNPDHPSILALKAEVDRLVSERTEREEKQAEYQALVRRQKGLYEKAESLVQTGKALDAIQAYETVVNSKLPDPQKLKAEASRKIASIQKQLTDKQAELEKEADSSYKKGDLKASIVTLQKALEINPENETLKGRVNSMLGELKKQMQTLYQEGVLEESVGEVETAKTKWKKIIETSLPDEDYYKKARIKLKKYGID